MENAISHRQFLLSLSPTEGHKVAKMYGYLTPSDEVVEQEAFDTLQGWVELEAAELSEKIEEMAWWMTTYANPGHWTPPLLVVFQKNLVAFLSAALIRLKKEGDIVLTSPVEVTVKKADPVTLQEEATDKWLTELSAHEAEFVDHLRGVVTDFDKDKKEHTDE